MRLLSVQILRAAAALAVAVGHAEILAAADAGRLGVPFIPSALLPWTAGVDLFFAISGFIMVVSSERLFAAPRGVSQFAGRRLIRIVPLYWAVACLDFLVLVRFGPADKAAALHWPAILATFAFWPSDTFGDGVLRPFTNLGWTLNYEMAFYGLFALMLRFRRETAVGLAILALEAGVVVGLVVAPSQAPFAVWLQPLVLDFALGMGIALLFRRGIVLGSAVRLALALAAVLALSIDGLNSAGQGGEWIPPTDLRRVLVWGVPAAILLAAAVLKPQGREPISGRVGDIAARLGDASYALYLTHVFVLVALHKVWLGTGLAAVLGFRPYVILAPVAAGVVALAVHRWFEAPLTRRLQAATAGLLAGSAAAERGSTLPRPFSGRGPA